MAEDRSNINCNLSAKVPYNFVRLPEHILSSGLEDYIKCKGNVEDFINRKGFFKKQEKREEVYKNFLESGDNISGYIDLELKTLTPLLINDGSGESYKLGNKYVIPGSSLRGMFKNIFKIITMGTMHKNEDYFDRHLFFRKLMATNSEYKWAHQLEKKYKEKMSYDGDSEGKKGSKVKPGFLIKVKNDKDYYIVPSRDKKEVIKKFISYDKLMSDKGKKQYRNSRVIWHDNNAYIWTGTLGIDEIFPPKGRKQCRLFNSMEDYEAAKDKCREKGVLFNPGKQIVRYISLEDVDWTNRTKVDTSDYKLDNDSKKENKGRVYLLDRMEGIKKFTNYNDFPDDVEEIVPCYYVPHDKCIDTFGHGRCFRVAYDNSISKVVAKSLEEYVVDYTDAVFGRSPLFASRVFFDDAIPNSMVNTMKPFDAHPLLQPNPTSFQLYLKNEKNKDLAHWDSKNAEIRGYKLYWHQNDTSPKIAEASLAEKDSDRKKKDLTKKLCKSMRPISAGSKFKSRIRFNNLLPEELGALIMTLDLNEEGSNIAYKLGQGKSIGLGSVKLNRYELFVEKTDAYTSFLDGNTMLGAYQHVEAAGYKKKFEEAATKVSKNDWERIINELKEMLDFNNTMLPGWSRETSLMRDNDGKIVSRCFAERWALPTIEDVLNSAKKK